MLCPWLHRFPALFLAIPLLLPASSAAIASSTCGPQTAASSGEINVRAAGAHGDGVTKDTAVLQQLLRRYPSATLYFPDGTYLLDNQGINSIGLHFEGFSGTVLMASGARFSCDTASTDAGQCIVVSNSTDAVFHNLSITYAEAAALPLPRDSAVSNALLVANAHNIMFWDTTITGSTGSGAWNTDSTGIGYFGITRISRTSADGLHFENVGNASVENLLTEDTGDDAIGDTNIAKSDPNCGLVVGRAQIRNSHARGIAVAGGCDATFRNVQITNTTYSGVAVIQDTSIDSRISTSVKISHAVIEGAGSLSSAPGNKYCLDIADSTYVTATDISCNGSADTGVFIYHNADHVLIRNVDLRSSGNNGFQSAGSTNVAFVNDRVTGAAGNGFDLEHSAHVNLQSCVSDTIAGYGFYQSGSSDVTGSGLSAHDTAMAKGNHRAWWAEEMAGPLSVNGLLISDGQASATGYIIGDANDSSAPITVVNITFSLKHGKPSIQRYSTDSKYFLRGQTKPAP